MTSFGVDYEVWIFQLHYTFKTALVRMLVEDYKLVLRPDRTASGEYEKQ